MLGLYLGKHVQLRVLRSCWLLFNHVVVLLILLLAFSYWITNKLLVILIRSARKFNGSFLKQLAAASFDDWHLCIVLLNPVFISPSASVLFQIQISHRLLVCIISKLLLLRYCIWSIKFLIVFVFYELRRINYRVVRVTSKHLSEMHRRTVRVLLFFNTCH